MPEAKGGTVYLQGEAFDYLPLQDRQMYFNPDTREYEASVLLKQGNYNYQYLYKGANDSVGATLPIEGDFHQTENEYSIFVYYRPMGARFDRLVGVSTIVNSEH